MEFKDLIQNSLRVAEEMPMLEILSVKESPCTKPGDNFMSVVSVMEVCGTLPGGAEYKRSVFVKRKHINEELREVFHVDEAFKNEMVMYSKVLPLYDAPIVCARCFYADSDLIILQNLLVEGYHLGNRQEGFSLLQTQNIIKALAKFHAISFQTSITQETLFMEAISLLKPVGVFLNSNNEMMESCLRRAVKILTGNNDLEDVVVFLRSLEGKVCETMRRLQAGEAVKVLCHGDIWLNNILLHEESEDPVRIVDLQACVMNSPAVDVWSFLYSNVSPNFLENYCDNLINLYCLTFNDILKTLNIPLKRVPSPEIVLKELLSKELYGFMMATFYLPALHVPPENFPDPDKFTKELIVDANYVEKFNTRGLRERICAIARICKKREVFSLRNSFASIVS